MNAPKLYIETTIPTETNILGEIHGRREKLARRFGNDIKKLAAHYREEQSRRAANGWHIVSSAAEPAATRSFVTSKRS